MINIPEWFKSDFIISQELESHEGTKAVTNHPIDVEEKLIIGDLLYCLIGANGNYIYYDKNNGKYLMSVKIHKCFESLINNILPICDNFKTIKNFTDNHYGFEYGSIIHAFCLPIRKIQNEHYQVIAKYENCPNLTIGLLLSNLQIPNEILKLLKNVIDKIGSSRGISVLTTLQKYYSTFRGAEHIRKILLYLFQETMKPFLRFIE